MSSPNTNLSFTHTNGRRLSVPETQNLYIEIAAGQQKRRKNHKNTASRPLPSPTISTTPHHPSLRDRDWRHLSETETQDIYAEFASQIQDYRVENKKKKCSWPRISKAIVKIEKQKSTSSDGGLVDRDWRQLSDAERQEIYAELASQIENYTLRKTPRTNINISTQTSTGTSPNGGFTHTNGRRLSETEAQTLYNGTAAGMRRENEKPFQRIKRWWGYT